MNTIATINPTATSTRQERDRHAALQLALATGQTDWMNMYGPDDVVAAAQKYYAFLSGQDPVSPAPNANDFGVGVPGKAAVVDPNAPCSNPYYAATTGVRE